jgi:hypothetical protein
MERISNHRIANEFITNLCKILSKKTSLRFGITLVEAITRALEKKYYFLNNINFNKDSKSEEIVNIDPVIDSIDPILVVQSMKAIIQVICMDLKLKSFSSLIDELSNNIDNEIINKFPEYGIDLDLLKIQHNYIYQKQKLKTNQIKNEKKINSYEKQNNLDYSWENVKDLKFDINNKVVTIIGKDRNVLDKLDLDEIVFKYLSNLSSEHTYEEDKKGFKKENILNVSK